MKGKKQVKKKGVCDVCGGEIHAKGLCKGCYSKARYEKIKRLKKPRGGTV